MAWKAKPSPGGPIGLAAALAVLTLDGALLLLLLRRPITLFSFVLALLIVLSLPLLALMGYWLYGFFRLRYLLDRNGLTIVWAATRQIIPMRRMIRAVRGETVEGEVEIRGVSWPGWHGPVADARHQGKVWLEKGMHRIDYYGVHTRGRMALVAAWRPPGQWMFRVIPQSAYVGVCKAEVQKIELVNGRLVPDFSAENEGEATLTGKAERYLIRMGFRSNFKVVPTGRYHWRWDFGDGASSTEQNPIHQYKGPAVGNPRGNYQYQYVVVLTVEGPGGTSRMSKVWDVAVK